MGKLSVIVIKYVLYFDHRNLLGKTPMDLATNDAMKKALRTPVNTESANKTLTVSISSKEVGRVYT